MPKISKKELRDLKRKEHKMKQKYKSNSTNNAELKEISDRIRFLENQQEQHNQPEQHNQVEANNQDNQAESDNQQKTNEYNIKLHYTNKITRENGNHVYFTFKSGFVNNIYNGSDIENYLNLIETNKLYLFVPWNNMQIAIIKSEKLAMCFTLGIDNYDLILSTDVNKRTVKICNTYQFTSDNKIYLAIIAKSIQTQLVNLAYSQYYLMTGKMINNLYLRITDSVEKSSISNEIPSEFAERYIKINEKPDNNFIHKINKMNIKACIKVSTTNPKKLIRTVEEKLGDKVICTILEEEEEEEEDVQNEQKLNIPPGHTNFSWNKRDSQVPCGHTNFSW